MLNSEDIQMLLRKTKMYILNITHLQKCLQRVKLTSIVCFDKKAQMIFMWKTAYCKN